MQCHEWVACPDVHRLVLTKLKPNAQMKVLFLPEVCSEACTNLLWKHTQRCVWAFIDLSPTKRVPSDYETWLDSFDPNMTYWFLKLRFNSFDQTNWVNLPTAVPSDDTNGIFILVAALSGVMSTRLQHTWCPSLTNWQGGVRVAVPAAGGCFGICGLSDNLSVVAQSWMRDPSPAAQHKKLHCTYIHIQ